MECQRKGFGHWNTYCSIASDYWDMAGQNWRTGAIGWHSHVGSGSVVFRHSLSSSGIEAKVLVGDALLV